MAELLAGAKKYQQYKFSPLSALLRHFPPEGARNYIPALCFFLPFSGEGCHEVTGKGLKITIHFERMYQ